MKSGFDATVDADVEALLRPTLAEFSRRFLELTVRVDCSSASVLGCVEEITSGTSCLRRNLEIEGEFADFILFLKITNFNKASEYF